MKKNNKKHTKLNYFPIKDDIVHAAGLSIKQIINIAGQTPLYIYDRKLIDQRINQLRSVLPQHIQLHYAIKANPMPAVVQHISSLVDGLDVASHGEMLTALNTGMKISEISFAGPGKTDQELQAAIASGITINIESEKELERISLIGMEQCIVPNIAIRVNPDFELKGAGVKMSGGAKPFGIDSEKIPALISLVKQHNVTFKGLHLFSGSQNLNAQAIIDAHNKTFYLAAELLKNNIINFQQINIGGGFGIPYFPGDEALDIQLIADNLQQLLKQYSIFYDKKIIIELGRYIVGEAGIYVTKIVDKKQSRGQTYLVTDGGLNHHLANSGNFGQILRKNYPVLLSKGKKDIEPGSEKEVVTIVGPLCTSLDIVADKIELSKAEVDDFIVVLQSGAYGKTASPENFLSHGAAKELLL